MARRIDGTSTILNAARTICRMEGRFGLSRFGARTNPTFQAAVAALVIACKLFEAADNYAGEIDEIAPDGPEDLE